MTKILIIEDEADILNVLKKRLSDSGFEVILSMDAYQGVEAAHKERPDLIVLDLVMPAGGGWSVLKNLKASTHTRDIPVIVLTGLKDKKQKERLFSQDIEAYFEKPYDPKELINKIKDILVI